jgi:hypothetical protein
MGRIVKKDGATTLLAGKEYVPASRTNVQETWRRHGWQPLHPTIPQGTDPTYQAKGKRS